MKKGTTTAQKSNTKGLKGRITRHLSVERVVVGGSILVSVFVIAVLLLSSRASQPTVTSGLPTPIGFPDTAQDVGTLVGQPAPAFTLTDDTGQPVNVAPGQTGRPIVLISHMGVG